ncbi:MAG: NAD(P)/FAD-dependent oxidoreductase [Alphaproteobacteria bacterium]
MADGADILVIGGGIAGASAAAELAAHGRVVLLERESQPGYHTTGRSAAMFTLSYGNRVIRTLARAAMDFLHEPPPGFATAPLVRQRGLMLFGREDQLARVRAHHEEVRALSPEAALIDAEAVRRLVPAFRPGYAAAAAYEEAAREIDVHALHGGFLRLLRARGGRIVTDADVTALARRGGVWEATTAAGAFAAPVVVNAAGAWADDVAALAGAAPLGLAPLRRTVVVFEAPVETRVDGWPMAVDIDEDFYFKPDAGRLFASPADETPSPPCDAQPEEIDIATALDRIGRATTLAPRRLVARWAGLRTFAPDRTPVAGFDGDVEGFVWLAGQGGYGIKTSPSLARAVAGLVAHGDLPEDQRALGLTAAALSPRRLRARPRGDGTSRG